MRWDVACGLGIAAIGIFLPFTGWPVPHWLAAAGVVVGLAVAGWPLLRWGARWYQSANSSPTKAEVSVRTTPTTRAGASVPAERDEWLQHGIKYVIYGDWGKHDDSRFGLSNAGNVADRMRELAGDGKIRIWGVSERGRLHEVIAPEFWAANQIALVSLFQKASQATTESATSRATGKRYVELKISKAEIEREWPKQNSSAGRVPLSEFIQRAIEKGWKADPYTKVGDLDYWTFTQRLRQALVDERLEAWGRLYRYDYPAGMADAEPLLKIPALHFHDYGLDGTQLFSETSNYDIFTYKAGGNRAKGTVYRDLHLVAGPAYQWLDQGAPE